LADSASSDEIRFNERIDLNVEYILERSFWIDWKIIFMTVRVVFLGMVNRDGGSMDGCKNEDCDAWPQAYSFQRRRY
jgi:hypothetical protein